MKFEKLKNSLDLFYDDEIFVRSKTRMDKHLKFVFDNKIHHFWEVILTLKNWLFYVHTKKCFIVD